MRRVWSGFRLWESEGGQDLVQDDVVEDRIAGLSETFGKAPGMRAGALDEIGLFEDGGTGTGPEGTDSDTCGDAGDMAECSTGIEFPGDSGYSRDANEFVRCIRREYDRLAER